MKWKFFYLPILLREKQRRRVCRLDHGGGQNSCTRLNQSLCLMLLSCCCRCRNYRYNKQMAIQLIDGVCIAHDGKIALQFDQQDKLFSHLSLLQNLSTHKRKLSIILSLQVKSETFNRDYNSCNSSKYTYLMRPIQVCKESDQIRSNESWFFPSISFVSLVVIVMWGVSTIDWANLRTNLPLINVDSNLLIIAN